MSKIFQEEVIVYAFFKEHQWCTLNVRVSACISAELTHVQRFLLSGPNRGHYIAIVKSHDFWLLFDDDIVEVREITQWQ